MIRATPAPAIVRLGRVDSTQAVAFALAADGAADGTVVVAESQAAGRGRRGRAWVDEPGASLLASVVLRPRLEPARLPGLSLAAGVAVAEALTRTAGLAPRLKWPNDVLVDGRKVSGILLESRLSVAPVRARWRELADTLGRPVTVDGISGVAVDIDVDGALLVHDAEGRRHRLVAGDVG
jgi:biotin-(acetyl-CoA carboxylase) ligase